jgi:HD-GYP domain-containing protein (c-di-GMP phosphodiesterase class II)
VLFRSLWARMIAILDAFDVMVNPQPYKPAATVDEALQELERQAGTQFDPCLVPVFIRMITAKGLIQAASLSKQKTGTTVPTASA